MMHNTQAKHCPYAAVLLNFYSETDLSQTEAGLHADFVETLFLLQDVSQSQSGGRSRKFLEC